MSWLVSGHHVVNFLHLVGVSICKTAPRTWMGMLHIALEEELEVLDYVQ